MQRICEHDGAAKWLELPDPNEIVMGSIRWGRADLLFTPAFWATQAWYCGDQQVPTPFRIGETFTEEVAACLLGGHGIRAEVALAAFHRLKEQGLLNGVTPSAAELCTVLSQPLLVEGRHIKYRFVRRKSEYLSEFLSSPATTNAETLAAPLLRSWLLTFRGIGLKTASWITRNWLGCDSVAVIDVHVYRAGIILGLFSSCEKIQQDYTILERKFLEFANRINVRASLLDVVMWRHMRAAGSLASAVA
jgi:N-glycosylase/DNA lyase